MENRIGSHTTLGKASLIIALLTIVFFILIIVSIVAVFFIQNSTIVLITSMSSFLMFIFSIVSIVLGAISYWGKDKDKYGLIAFIIGIVFLVLVFITVAISATVYVYVSGMLGPSEHNSTPFVSFSPTINDNNCSLTIQYISSSDNLKWNELDWSLYDQTDTKTISTGLTFPYYDSTEVEAGQIISITGLTKGNEYSITLIYKPSGNAAGSYSWTQ